ncbi:hypothetical protein SCB71_02625 [Herbiconiux sp. KACC 21604]|uniref:sensor histidine kinase n=1 Tax=unclassified Herbiconiux TaxID=2618217 RepID=UPI00149156DA|nr:ATP-binding protein [Herbiconiux sp. SALV-R1]QJU52305.1 hypothetical protein HL652_00605 [Herbiconiux sp. SALV-R1]WPO87153.1 hypothetical protein SCB71_02625 [Herbiconiux sp. KACC 21604]
MTDAPAARDRIDDRTVTILAFGVVMAIFAVGISVQTVYVLGIQPSWQRGGTPVAETLNLAVRLSANFAAVGLGLVGIALLDPQERRLAGRLGTGAVIAVGAAALRGALQLGLGIYSPSQISEVTAEIVTASIAVGISLAIALALTDARRRLRTEERAYAEQTVRAAAALEALQGEELRVRREVADGLHGTVQQRFIVLGARLESAIDAAGSLEGGAAIADELRSIRDDLGSLRQQDLRTMSELLYPARLDQGTVPAVRALFQRIPASIATSLAVSDEVVALEGEGNRVLPAERRLLIVRIVEEALSNALKHGRATALELELSVDASGSFVLAFDDDGIGLPAEPSELGLSGLGRLQRQLDHIGGRLELQPSPLGGARTRAVVPR